MKLSIKKKLDKNALHISYEYFNKKAGTNWTLEQYVKSLKNQPYIKFLVFYDQKEIVGIVDYTYDNPWKEVKWDIEYYKNLEIKKYMEDYVKKIIEIKITNSNEKN